MLNVAFAGNEKKINYTCWHTTQTQREAPRTCQLNLPLLAVATVQTAHHLFINYDIMSRSALQSKTSLMQNISFLENICFLSMQSLEFEVVIAYNL